MLRNCQNGSMVLGVVLNKYLKQHPCLQAKWGKVMALLKAVVSSGVMYNTTINVLLMPSISYGLRMLAIPWPMLDTYTDMPYNFAGVSVRTPCQVVASTVVRWLL